MIGWPRLYLSKFIYLDCPTMVRLPWTKQGKGTTKQISNTDRYGNSCTRDPGVDHWTLKVKWTSTNMNHGISCCFVCKHNYCQLYAVNASRDWIEVERCARKHTNCNFVFKRQWWCIYKKNTITLESDSKWENHELHITEHLYYIKCRYAGCIENNHLVATNWHYSYCCTVSIKLFF